MLAAAKPKRAAKPKSRKPAEDAPSKRLIIPRPDILHNYLDYRQINQYLDFLGNRYSYFVKIHTLGLSHERREVRAIEINWMNPHNVELPQQIRFKMTEPQDMSEEGPIVKGPILGTQGRNIVFIEAGTHAREWITISTALNCIYQLTERYTRNVEMLRKLRFIIVPLVNPDGYEYSRAKNRNWRKNRRPHKHTKFVGTDCNRNYDIFWEYGPSKINRITYKGEKPFSESETRAMRNVLDRLQPDLLFFLSLHSYGQSIMYPWAYSKEPPHHWRELHTLANTGRSAIKSYNGREYRTGSISGLTKRTITGSVVDYVYGVLKAPMALVMELPSRDLGFQPPVEMVSQIGHESWFGIREMCKRAYDLRAMIKRDLEPVLPTPAMPLPLPEEMLRAEGGDAQSAVAVDRSADEAAGDGPKERTKQKKSKKGKKRVKRQRPSHMSHQAILEIQKRSNAASKRSTALSTKRSRIGCGDGIYKNRLRTEPYIPESMTSKLPLGCFL